MSKVIEASFLYPLNGNHEDEVHDNHRQTNCLEAVCSAFVIAFWHKKRMNRAARPPRKKHVTRTIERKHVADIVIATIASDTRAIIKRCRRCVAWWFNNVQ